MSCESRAGLIVLISGAIASGKSIVASGLQRRLGARVLSSRAIILELSPNAGQTRLELQESGARLEAETGGQWLATIVVDTASSAAICVVDSVHTHRQVSAVRRRLPLVIHVHVVATEEIRRRRFEARSVKRPESSSYEDAAGHAIEAEVDELALIADCVVDTTQLTADQALEGVVELLGNILGG